jgi:glutathione peroxidase
MNHNSRMRITGLLLAGLCLSAALVAGAAASNLYHIPLKDIDGKSTSLEAYKGQVLLLVNVASKCGYTPQYKGLEALQKKYHGKGFEVLAFPSNDFGAQEPGTNQEIKEFCSSNYQVSFPLFDKIHVVGPEQHPLYAALTGKDSPVSGPVKWNFTKFLVGRDGKVLKRFDSKVAPDAPELISAIEAALAKK